MTGHPGQPDMILVACHVAPFDQMGRSGAAAVTTTDSAPWLGQRDSVPLSGPEEHRHWLIMFCNDRAQSDSRERGRSTRPSDAAAVRVCGRVFLSVGIPGPDQRNGKMNSPYVPSSREESE